jgi:UDP-N-acetylmuramate--alanine ligase
MCGIAEVLLNMGYQISGSDIHSSENVKRLIDLGARVYIGHKSQNIDKPHVVVVSSAIDKNNSEIQAAYKKNIPVIPRAEMLAEIMRLKYALCVAGTHGKTTTTSMIGLILYKAGIDPTVVIGGRFNNLESNAKLGTGEFIVAEADESDGSFLHFSPAISIVTNIDDDHLDYYDDLNSLKKTFIEFLNKVPFYGFSVLCGDDRNLKSIFPFLKRPYKTYGLEEFNDYVACDVRLYPEKSVYKIKKNGEIFDELVVNSFGMHNILNSLAASAAAIEMGIELEVIKKALLDYKGVGRRLERVGVANGIDFFDDYAHHPTEITLSLNSIKKVYPDKKLFVIFQPHRFSRTRDLYKEFPKSLKIADHVYITDIYPAGEKVIDGISSQLIVNEFDDKNKIKYISKTCDLLNDIESGLSNGDICITLGAGNVHDIGVELRKRLNKNSP